MYNMRAVSGIIHDGDGKRVHRAKRAHRSLAPRDDDHCSDDVSPVHRALRASVAPEITKNISGKITGNNLSR